MNVILICAECGEDTFISYKEFLEHKKLHEISVDLDKKTN